MKREKEPVPRDARAISPARIIAVSFAIVIALGTLLLLLPACTAPGKHTTFLDALFTATSASCVTGLVTVDTGTHWSTAGQLVIMLLLQIGGLGLVTFTTFFNVMIGRASDSGPAFSRRSRSTAPAWKISPCWYGWW